MENYYNDNDINDKENDVELRSQISFSNFKSNMPKGLENYVLGCIFKSQFSNDENENLATIIKNNLDMDNHGFYYLCVQIKDVNAGFSFAYGCIADYYLRIELNKSVFLIFAKKIRSERYMNNDYE
ncbi:MAG: hypothetical protein MJ252_14525 [archaeon]|nr:hypothetical protein [archaeon]